MTDAPRYEGGSTRKSFSEIVRDLRRVLHFFKPHRAQIGLFLFLLFVATVLPLAVPPCIGKAVEIITGPASSEEHARVSLMVLCMVLLVLQTALMTVRYFREVQSKRLGETLVQEIRRRLFDHLLRLSARFYDRERVGGLANRVLDESRVLEEMFHEGLGAFLLAPLGFLGMWAVMMTLDWRMALLALVPIPFMILTMAYAVRRLRGLNRMHKDSSEDMASYLVQRFSGIRTVQLMGQEEAERERFRERGEAMLDLKVRIARMAGRYFPLMGWITSASVILVLAYFGVGMDGRSVRVGPLVTFLSYLMVFYGPVIEMTRAHYLLQNMALSAERIFDILDRTPDIQDRADAVDVDRGRLDLRFEGVSFQYETSRPVLRDVSVSFPYGGCFGISGPTGAGKSTLAKLIVRMEDPTSGTVSLGGLDLRVVRLASLRSAVTLVAQEDFLFHDTIRNNLTYGCPGASADDVERALRRVSGWDLVQRLPQRLDTTIGERGVLLSAGERQKICLARALLRRPAVLILDEATSAMDGGTERAVLKDVLMEREGQTTIVISHRPSALDVCSRRLKVEGGTVRDIPVS